MHETYIKSTGLPAALVPAAGHTGMIACIPLNTVIVIPDLDQNEGFEIVVHKAYFDFRVVSVTHQCRLFIGAVMNDEDEAFEDNAGTMADFANDEGSLDEMIQTGYDANDDWGFDLLYPPNKGRLAGSGGTLATLITEWKGRLDLTKTIKAFLKSYYESDQNQISGSVVIGVINTSEAVFAGKGVLDLIIEYDRKYNKPLKRFFPTR